MATKTHSRLKNYKKIETSYQGSASWKLIGHHGPVEAFELFANNMIDDGVPFNTRKSYCTAVTFFLDYLYESGVFEQSTTKKQLKRAVQNYRHFLAKGAKSTNKEVVRMVQSLPHKVPKAPATIQVELAAVRGFLELSNDVAEEQIELIKHRTGKDVVLDLDPINSIVNAMDKASHNERMQLKHTLLGGVIRDAANGYRVRIRSLAKNINKSNTPIDTRWEFPFDHLGRLVDGAKTIRDKAIYCLLIGGGIRYHEALNLRWPYVDVEKRIVYIVDPRSERDLLTEEDKKVFKGRNVSRVFMYEPFKTMFFVFLEKYVNSKEFVNTGKHDYVFQITQGNRKGAPYYLAGHANFWRTFTKLVNRLDIPSRPDGKAWNPHSLRDSYGVWMKNYIPCEHGNGLPIEIVMRLMGHSRIESTEIYARQDLDDIDERLEYFDKLVLGKKYTADDLNKVRAERKLLELRSLLPNKELQQLIGASE